MDVYVTEEQQIEAIKKWWKANGNSILIGIVVAIIAVLGWQGWRQHQRDSGESAAAVYGQMMDAAKLAQQDRLDNKTKERDAQLATINHLGQQLKDTYSGTEYGTFAAMLLAREAVLANKLDDAVSELTWANEHAKSEGVRLIANLRLARVLAAKEDYDAALKQLDSVKPGAQEDSYEEVRGDIYVQQGNVEKAREAYQQAMLLSAEKNGGTARPILKIKHDNLLVADK